MKNLLITNSIEELLYFLKKNLNNIKVYTSNYTIYNYCKNYKLEAILLDSLIDEEDFNKICKNSYEIENKLNDYLNRIDPIYFNNLFDSIRMTNYNLLNSTIYFSFILTKLFKNLEKESIIHIFKNKDDKSESPLDPSYKRHDNICSFILENIDSKNVKFYKALKNNTKNINSNEERISNLAKLIFKFFYNDINTFLFKIWRNKFFYKIYIFSLSFFKFKTIYLYDCYEANELMQSMFCKLFKKQIKLVKIHKFSYKFINNENNKYSKDVKFILNDVLNYLNENEIIETEKLIKNSITNLISKKICSIMSCYEHNKVRLEEYFDYKFMNLKKGDIIYSRGYFRSYEKLMYFYLKNKGIESIVFEHGITHGFSYHTKYISKFYDLKYSDKVIYLCPLSTSYLEKQNNTRIFFSGIPNLFKTNFLNKFINKKLIKFLLKIKLSKTIIYAPYPDINNYILGPYYPRDINIIQNFEVIDYLCKKYKDCNIILKLYPSNRYVDNYKYGELIKKYENLKIIKSLDLRYIMFLSDIIFTTLPTSTIGNIYKSKIEGYFLQFSWNRIFKNNSNNKIKINGVKNIFDISEFKELEYKWNLDFINKII